MSISRGGLRLSISLHCY